MKILLYQSVSNILPVNFPYFICTCMMWIWWKLCDRWMHGQMNRWMHLIYNTSMVLGLGVEGIVHQIYNVRCLESGVGVSFWMFFIWSNWVNGQITVTNISIDEFAVNKITLRFAGNQLTAKTRPYIDRASGPHIKTRIYNGNIDYSWKFREK